MLSRLNAVAFSTLFRAELMVSFKRWKQTYFPVLVTAALYFVIFGKVVGGYVGHIGHSHYIDFLIPGVVMMQMIMASYNTATFCIFIAKLHRHIENLLTSPMSNHVILCGYLAACVCRGLIVGFLVLMLAAFFTQLHLQHPYLVLIVAILSCVLLSLLGLINGIYAKSFEDISIIPSFVLTPLTFLGGVFYSVHSLPGIWYYFSLLNPLYYIINAFRYGFLGGQHFHVLPAIMVILAFIIVLYSLAFYLLEKGYRIKS